MSDHLDQLLSALPRGVATFNNRFEVEYCNQNFKKNFRKKNTGEITGVTLSDIFGEKLWKQMIGAAQEVLITKRKKEIPLSNVSLEDTPLRPSTRITFFSIPSKVGSQAGIILRNAQREIDAEQTLAHYKDRLEQAQRAGKIGVFEWNIRTNDIWWSDEEEAIFGVSPGRFEGTFNDWIQATYQNDRAALKKEIKRCIREKEELDVEFRVLYPGNIFHWIRLKGHIYYENGDAVRMVGVNYDITSRRQYEDLLEFKAEASRTLSSSLNYKNTLAKVAELAVEHIADWCSVDMINDESGEVELITATHRNPEKVKWALKIRKRYPVDMSQNTGLPLVLKTGKSLYVPFISQEEVIKNAQNLKQKKLLRKIGIHSIMIIPLTIGKNPIGAITFVSAESKRQYSEQDLEFAEQLASRASLAIENARLYESMRDEQERLDSLLSNVPGVVWEAWGNPIAKTQKITYVSAHAERLLGYPREDWLTKPNFWLTIMHPDDKELASRVAADNFEKQDTGISRFRWLTKDGKALWMESQSHIVKDEFGRPIGMRGVVIDISDGMEQVRKKDEFISLASHELKTPITTIKAYTQLLKAKASDKTTNNYLDKMDLQVNKLTRLISHLLDVTKIQEGKLEMNPQEADLDAFIQSTVQDLQTIINSHTLETDLQSKATILVDHDRLAQVITNIINNAVKYSPVSNRIIIRSFVKNGNAVVEVQDFGIGIDLKHQRNIFTRFYRVDNGTQAPGLGIGLFLSKEILTRHGGSLTVTSKAKQGSTFTFTLPIR